MDFLKGKEGLLPPCFMMAMAIALRRLAEPADLPHLPITTVSYKGMVCYLIEIY